MRPRIACRRYLWGCSRAGFQNLCAAEVYNPAPSGRLRPSKDDGRRRPVVFDRGRRLATRLSATSLVFVRFHLRKRGITVKKLLIAASLSVAMLAACEKPA